MSKKDTENFLEVIAKDAAMKEELQEVYSRTLVEFAQTKGFHFTLEEFIESIKDGNYLALPDSALEAVAGGGYCDVFNCPWDE